MTTIVEDDIDLDLDLKVRFLTTNARAAGTTVAKELITINGCTDTPTTCKTDSCTAYTMCGNTCPL